MLSPLVVSRLEKAATDNVFDHALTPEGDWLVFASTQCPLRIWLGTFGDAVFLAAFSQQNVARALAEYGTSMAAPMPRAAAGGRTAPLGSCGRVRCWHVELSLHRNRCSRVDL